MIKNRILAFALCLVLLFSFSVLAFADDSTVADQNTEYYKVSDPTGVLKLKDTLNDKADKYSEEQQFAFTAIIVDSLEGKTAEALADDYYDYGNYGYGSNKDGCMLLISINDREWHISTCGFGITAFTDYGIQYIGEQLAPLMKDSDWDGAVDKYLDLANDFVTQAKAGKPYTKSTLPQTPKTPAENLKAIVISLAVSIIIALIVTKVIKKKYKPVSMKANASDYLVAGSLQLTGSYDNFRTSSVSRTPINNNSNGSSTHTSSSGRTHGGGGGSF